jgi:hypothetical protein
MLARDDEKVVYVLFSNGKWTSVGEAVVEREAVSPDPTGRPGILMPLASATAILKPTGGGRAVTPVATPFVREPVAVARGFERALKDRAEVRESLGKPTAVDLQLAGAARAFANGNVLASERRNVYVLRADGRWFEFAFFTGPTPTPRWSAKSRYGAALG